MSVDGLIRARAREVSSGHFPGFLLSEEGAQGSGVGMKQREFFALGDVIGASTRVRPTDLSGTRKRCEVPWVPTAAISCSSTMRG